MQVHPVHTTCVNISTPVQNTHENILVAKRIKFKGQSKQSFPQEFIHIHGLDNFSNKGFSLTFLKGVPFLPQSARCIGKNVHLKSKMVRKKSIGDYEVLPNVPLTALLKSRQR